MHVDMDAFYAAVEVKEQPALNSKAVVVGGTGGRGVVCSANYEARAYGVHSAMPTAHARRLCPHAVFLPPRFDRYQSYSRELHRVLGQVTPLVEGIALDEAFLDITGAITLFGPPQAIGARLRAQVAGELGLECSVGAGPNKLVAKLASKRAKPAADRRGPRAGPGVVVVAQEEVLDFLWPLPVGALWGVGRAAEQRLARLGVATVGALAALPREAVLTALGKVAGEVAHDMAWGRDVRPVEPQRPAKSVGAEETYPSDVADHAWLRQRLVVLADLVAARLRQQHALARTVTLKVRYHDFATITRSHTFAFPRTTGPAFGDAAGVLLEQVEVRQGVRLLGISVSGLVDAPSAPGEQLSLELDGPSPLTRREVVAGAQPGGAGPGWQEASQAMDAIRERFGHEAVRPGAALGSPARAPWPHGRDGQN